MEVVIVLNADDQFYNFHKKIAKKKNLNIYSFSLIKKNYRNLFKFQLKKIKLKYKISINIGNLKKYFLY